jgi:hypothetical protein
MRFSKPEIMDVQKSIREVQKKCEETAKYAIYLESPCPMACCYITVTHPTISCEF